MGNTEGLKLSAGIYACLSNSDFLNCSVTPAETGPDQGSISTPVFLGPQGRDTFCGKFYRCTLLQSFRLVPHHMGRYPRMRNNLLHTHISCIRDPQFYYKIRICSPPHTYLKKSLSRHTLLSNNHYNPAHC